ncbi:MAG TPA: pyridoxamine 5'-phosphate oxidase family protein [Acidimicrobiales bacterium]|nr:pyridoxamine 5'-phosphate oxidase family protein [Acidimicrobiales bacterium]
MIVDDEGFALLEEDECFDLLGQSSIGRVGVTIGAIPAIFPVNFSLIDRNIFFFTAPGTKFSAALRNAVVAFEVDHVDPIYHEGWSVLVAGKSHEVADEALLRRVKRSPLEPWAPGERSHVVCIDPDFVSGRSILHTSGVRASDR